MVSLSKTCALHDLLCAQGVKVQPMKDNLPVAEDAIARLGAAIVWGKTNRAWIDPVMSADPALEGNAGMAGDHAVDTARVRFNRINFALEDTCIFRWPNESVD